MVECTLLSYDERHLEINTVWSVGEPFTSWKRINESHNYQSIINSINRAVILYADDSELCELESEGDSFGDS